MDKKLKGSKTDEIFLKQKNAYSKLMNKNHIYNNSYINVDVYTKWRNLTIDRDEKKIWEDRMIYMVLNMDSNMMDKSVRNLIRKGVPDSLKHLIWIRSNDVNYFAINFPKFYETTLYNTFGDKIPENLSNDCPTFCGGILGLQEDIMCVQTKIEEIEIDDNTIEGDNFNINDSTSNILQLLFNTPNEMKKDSDKYLLPEHNFWIEPKALSSPNFYFAASTVNSKKKKKFFYIESVKNKILKSKKLDKYLRVASDSILPCPNNFEGQNGEGNNGGGGEEEEGMEQVEPNKNGKGATTIIDTAEADRVRVIRNNFDPLTSIGGTIQNKKQENVAQKEVFTIADGSDMAKIKKQTNNGENEGKNKYNIILPGGEEYSTAIGADEKGKKQVEMSGEFKVSNNDSSGKNIFIKDDIISFEEITDKQGKDNRAGKDRLESLLCHIEKEKQKYGNTSTTKNNNPQNLKCAPEVNKYLHIQYYMNEQYRISKKQAEKMFKAKLYIRNKRKKKYAKYEKRKEGFSMCEHKSSLRGKERHEGKCPTPDYECRSNISAESFQNTESEHFRYERQPSSLKKTKSFFKKKFHTRQSFSAQKKRNLSDHITLLLNQNSLLDNGEEEVEEEENDECGSQGNKRKDDFPLAETKQRGASMTCLTVSEQQTQKEKHQIDSYQGHNKMKYKEKMPETKEKGRGKTKHAEATNDERGEYQWEQKQKHQSEPENEQEYIVNLSTFKSNKSKHGHHVLDFTELTEGVVNKEGNRGKYGDKNSDDEYEHSKKTSIIEVGDDTELQSNNKNKHSYKKYIFKKLKSIFYGKKKEKGKDETINAKEKSLEDAKKKKKIRIRAFRSL